MLFMGVCRLLGWLALLLTYTVYLLFSPVPLLFCAIVYYPILLYSSMGGRLWNVLVCFLWVCVPIAWVVVYIAYIHCISSLLFCSFACSPLFFTILFYSIPVWAVACGMCRYVFYRCVSVAWGIAVGSLWNVSVCFLCVCRLSLYCLHSLYLLSSLLFICFSLLFCTILF